MEEFIRFETRLVLTLYRATNTDLIPEWEVVDSGPGIFRLDPAQSYGVRLKSISPAELRAFLAETSRPELWKMINLSENRNLNDQAIGQLARLTALEHLNLSAVDLTGESLSFLPNLRNLRTLDLSYCNRLSARYLGVILKCRALIRLNLLGCSRLTNRDVKALQRNGLTIQY